MQRTGQHRNHNITAHYSGTITTTGVHHHRHDTHTHTHTHTHSNTTNGSKHHSQQQPWLNHRSSQHTQENGVGWMRWRTTTQHRDGAMTHNLHECTSQAPQQTQPNHFTTNSHSTKPRTNTQQHMTPTTARRTNNYFNRRCLQAQTICQASLTTCLFTVHKHIEALSNITSRHYANTVKLQPSTTRSTNMWSTCAPAQETNKHKTDITRTCILQHSLPTLVYPHTSTRAVPTHAHRIQQHHLFCCVHFVKGRPQHHVLRCQLGRRGCLDGHCHGLGGEVLAQDHL